MKELIIKCRVESRTGARNQASGAQRCRHAGRVLQEDLRATTYTEMCSGSEARLYVRRIDFVYHSTLGLKGIKKKKKDAEGGRARAGRHCRGRQGARDVEGDSGGNGFLFFFITLKPRVE